MTQQKESHWNVWEKGIPDKGPEAGARRPQCGGDVGTGQLEIRSEKELASLGGLVSISSISALIRVKWGPNRQRETRSGLAWRKYSRAR